MTADDVYRIWHGMGLSVTSKNDLLAFAQIIAKIEREALMATMLHKWAQENEQTKE